MPALDDLEIGKKNKKKIAGNPVSSLSHNICYPLKDHFILNVTFHTQSRVLITIRKKGIVGKRENTGYMHFLLFQQCFLLCQNQINHLSRIEIIVCNSF